LTIIPQKLLGDCREVLKSVPDQSVHCCITSPPYWGLRSYLPKGHPLKHLEIGSEPTMELYLEHLLQAFREVWRVLRDDGTLVVNMGDAYAGGKSSGKNYTSAEGGYQGQRIRRGTDCDPKRGAAAIDQPFARHVTGLKPKDLMMMPARVAMALQADGWFLRSQIPWLKKSAMPESVTDRPATAIEYLYLFSKSEAYYWDRYGVMMQSSDNTHPRTGRDGSFRANKVTDQMRLENGRVRAPAIGLNPKTHHAEKGTKQNVSFTAGCSQYVVGQRNRRNSDWLMESFQGLVLDELGGPLAMIVNPKGTKIQHFASYPHKLVEPFIKAGTSERGCCADCGSSWKRMVGERAITDGRSSGNKARKFRDENGGNPERQTHQGFGFPYEPATTPTLGWRPDCECHGKLARGKVIIPARISKEDASANWGADSNGEYLGLSTKGHAAHGVQDASDVKARIIRNATEDREVEDWIYQSDLPLDAHPVKPCTVLDLFGGTSTTAEVATALGRRSIVCELNPEYAEAARQRDSQGALAILPPAAQC
jgi:DNA modification methylase